IHIGYEQQGGRGLVVAGTCFILPAVLITGGFAYLYVTYGSLPNVEPFLYGIRPAVLAVILGAVWRLGRQAVTSWRLALMGIAVAAVVVGGVNEILAFFVGSVLGAIWLRGTDSGSSDTASRFVPILFLQRIASDSTALAAGTGVAAAAGISLWKLFLFFLKIGAILYGSGYVLVAFLEGGLVQDYGWLTQEQLLDAIAIGQFTPGPVLSTATFIGYVLDGAPGALVATAGIFLPSFLFVLILNPLIPRMRESAWLSAFLDAVNVAAVALMVAVTIQPGMSTLIAWPAWRIALASAVGVGRASCRERVYIWGAALYLRK